MIFRHLVTLGTLGLLYAGCSSTDPSGKSSGAASTPSPSDASTSAPGTETGGAGSTIHGTGSTTKSPGSVSTTRAPATVTVGPTVPPTSNCPGKRLGQYTWGTQLWRQGERALSDFFATSDGKEWGCGDVTINIGDFSAPRTIAYSGDIVPFIQRYRQSSQNYESVVWLSYGDVVSGDGSLMETFVDTFFQWVGTITADVAATLGTIGLSFDVEHMPAASTKSALQKAQSLKSSTNFAPGKLLIQHTMEGKPNPDGTDYVMKYADSALVMLYRNYMESPIFKPDSNILSRAQYFLQDQCVYCLDDAYAAANYKAKLTIMVEASCSPSDYCAKISFCAHDAAGEGATYMWNTLQDLESGMLSSGLVTPAQFSRLFNPLTTFAVHDWSWFRCYEPLTASSSTSQCKNYMSAAETCRNTLGPVAISP